VCVCVCLARKLMYNNIPMVCSFLCVCVCVCARARARLYMHISMHLPVCLYLSLSVSICLYLSLTLSYYMHTGACKALMYDFVRMARKCKGKEAEQTSEIEEGGGGQGGEGDVTEDDCEMYGIKTPVSRGVCL